MRRFQTPKQTKPALRSTRAYIQHPELFLDFSCGIVRLGVKTPYAISPQLERIVRRMFNADKFWNEEWTYQALIIALCGVPERVMISKDVMRFIDPKPETIEA